MERCIICGELQDSRIFEPYNICTACADIMEDIMGEYFLRTIYRKEPRVHGAYMRYLENTRNYASDYKKLVTKSGKHTKDISSRVPDMLMETGENQTKKRYFEHMSKVLDWLEDTPYFYHYYFRNYYVCPNCGSSIFEKYSCADIGQWLVISCSGCNTVIKKYYSPKFI